MYCLDIKRKVWQHYTLSNSNNDIVFSFTPVRNGLYVCHLNGLDFIDNNGEIHQSDIRDNAYSVLEDSARHCLWIGTEHALIRRDINTGDTKAVLSGSTFNRIILSPNKDLLLASEYGLLIYNPESSSISTISHNATMPGTGLPSNRINYIFLDRQDNIWLATDRGVAFAQFESNFDYISLVDITHIHDGNVFSHILVDTRGEQWLAGDNGIIHITSQGIKWFKVGNGLRKNMIRCIYEDRDHDIWIATDASIAIYNRNNDSFSYFNITDRYGRNSNWAYDIYEDELGRMWIATYMGGLYIVDKKELLTSGGNYEMKESPMSKFDNDLSTIYQFIPDGNGILWAYTSRGLETINTKTYQVSLKRKMFLDAMTIAGGNVWIDIQGHLYRFSIKDNKLYDTKFQVPNGMIYSLVPEKERVWLSTTEGLYYIDTRNNSIHPFGKPDCDLYTGVFIPDSNIILWGGEDLIAKQLINHSNSITRLSKVYITDVTIDGKPIGADKFSSSIIELNGRKNITINFATFDYKNRNSEVYWYKIGRDGAWKSLPVGTNSLTIPYIQGGNYELLLSTDPFSEGAIITKVKLKIAYPWYLRWWAIMIYIVLALSVIHIVFLYYKKHENAILKEKERENNLALTQQKMEFFVDMSHELKTPLSLIIAPLEKILSETTNAKLRAKLKDIQANALRLNDIIHRILDYKRLETESDDQILSSHVDIVSLLKSCIGEFAEQAKARGIQIDFEHDKDNIWMDIDIVKIEMVVDNILSNAMKYVEDNTGKIVVSEVCSSNEVIIKINDNGPGVANNELKKIFNRYYKGDNNHNGTGIGLAVVKKYVELHNGHVWAENDKGFQISFSLPYNNLQQDTKSGSSMEDEGDKPKVLIVDDNHEMVEFLSTALASSYITIKSYSGEQALELIKSEIPDIIITDQMMPGMDGMELCRRLRHNHTTKNIPIIMLTAKDDYETELKGIENGADVFMPKPFDLKKLQLHLVQLLKKQKSLVQSIHIDALTQMKEDSGEPLGDEALMKKVVQIINDNISSEDLNVNKLSNLMGMDQKQLYRKIKLLTGETPVSYIRNQRLARAASLLENGGLSVSEIMYQIGFNSPSYFTKCFTKKYGMTPKEYKEKYNKK